MDFSMTRAAHLLLDKFKLACQSQPVDVATAQDLLLQLKLQIASFNLNPPFTEKIEITRSKLLLARETLELGAGLAIECKDMASFDRSIQQLRPFYSDFKSLLPESAYQLPLTGAYLLGLLCQNRIDSFHSELELISIELRDSPVISFPIELERCLMEGSYHKVLNCPVPRPQFRFFVHILGQTVRERIAECSEKAYESVLISEAGELLMLDERSTLQQAQQRNWQVRSGVLYFPKEADMSLDIPSKRVISQTLAYATELERIV